MTNKIKHLEYATGGIGHASPLDTAVERGKGENTVATEMGMIAETMQKHRAAMWEVHPRVRVDTLRAGDRGIAKDGVIYTYVRKDGALSGCHHVKDEFGAKTSFAGCAEWVRLIGGCTCAIGDNFQDGRDCNCPIHGDGYAKK